MWLRYSEKWEGFWFKGANTEGFWLTLQLLVILVQNGVTSRSFGSNGTFGSSSASGGFALKIALSSYFWFRLDF
jgi:hypothetical protein